FLADAPARPPQAPRDPLRSCTTEDAEPNREREGSKENGKDNDCDKNARPDIVSQPLNSQIAGPVRDPGEAQRSCGNQQEIKNKTDHCLTHCTALLGSESSMADGNS